MTTITDTIAGVLLDEHNAGFDNGTEREFYETPPIWMQRKAERLAAAIELIIQRKAELAGALASEALS